MITIKAISKAVKANMKDVDQKVRVVLMKNGLVLCIAEFNDFDCMLKSGNLCAGVRNALEIDIKDADKYIVETVTGRY